MTFIHHDRVCAQRCPDDGSAGCFDIVEDDGQFRVIDGDATSEPCDDLDEAREVAQQYADQYDRDHAPRKFRVRRCEGNKSCWLLVRLRDDGTEIDSYGGWITGQLDTLLRIAPEHLRPRVCDTIDWVL
jgi:hypothetical protein